MFSHSILELWPQSHLSSIVSIAKSFFLSFSCNPIGLYCVCASHQSWLDLQGFPKLNSWHLEVGPYLRKLLFTKLTHLLWFTPVAPESQTWTFLSSSCLSLSYCCLAQKSQAP